MTEQEFEKKYPRQNDGYCYVEKRTVFDDTFTFPKKVIFGYRCKLGDGCELGDECRLGDRCRLGDGCKLGDYNFDLLKCSIGTVSNHLTIELMRWDASSHANPDAFDVWARGGDCPYHNYQGIRLLNFNEDRNIWKPGKPEMSIFELLLAICKEKNWILPEG